MAIERIGRASTYGLFQRTMGDVNDISKRIAQLNLQISSGYKTDIYAGLGTQADRLIELDNSIGRTERYIQENKQVITRLETMDVALEGIIGAAGDLRDLIVLDISANNDDLPVNTQANAILLDLAASLNMQLDGRYLFAGSKTGQAPVTEPITTPNPATALSSHYYNGDEATITARIQDNFEIDYTVHANDEGFQKMVAAAHTAIAGHASDHDPTKQSALDLVNEALDDIIAYRAKIQSAKVTVESVNTRHEKLLAYSQSVRSDIVDTDIIAATSELANNEALLQASFQVFARTIQLRLSDYL